MSNGAYNQCQHTMPSVLDLQHIARLSGGIYAYSGVLGLTTSRIMGALI